MTDQSKHYGKDLPVEETPERDDSLKGMFTLSAMKNIVKRTQYTVTNESSLRKMFIVISSCTFAVLSLMCALFWLVRADSAKMFNDDIIVTDPNRSADSDTTSFDAC